jgi:hypothetical protein
LTATSPAWAQIHVAIVLAVIDVDFRLAKVTSLTGARMDVHDSTDSEPWHSPERAWVPMMWLIRVVAIGLALVLFSPLWRLVVPST